MLRLVFGLLYITLDCCDIINASSVSCTVAVHLLRSLSMATGSPPAKLVQSILLYVKQRAGTMTGDALQSLVAAQCQSCVLHLRSASISYDDAHTIMALLNGGDCMFSSDQIAQVSAVIDQKLTLATPCSGAHGPQQWAGTQQQTHKHLRHYLTDMLWAVINSHVPMSTKLEQCAQFFVNVLHLRNPSEPTRRDMVAIIRAAINDSSTPEDTHAHMSRCDGTQLVKKSTCFDMHNIEVFRYPCITLRYPTSIIRTSTPTCIFVK